MSGSSRWWRRGCHPPRGYAQNVRSAGDYQACVGRGELATCRGYVLTAEDELRRHVILALLCAGKVDKGEVEARFACRFDRHFSTELERLYPLAEDGLVHLSADRVEVTPLGRLLVRVVANVFDADQDGAPGSRL
jgi:oxygen-independent coproporphyrinogen-3 oxidase